MKYQIKYLEKNGKRDDLVFHFENADMERILPIFLYGDVVNFHNEIKGQLDLVLSGKRRRIECSGNNCFWRIGKRHTLIVDSFASEGEPSEITVDTAELRRLIDEWIEARKKFREERKKDSHSSDERES